LKLEKYSVLGWSDGGITALILAATFPDSIKKLVVWGANAFIHEKDCAIYKGK
jgi:valacyclovir hydrolase